MSSSTTIRPAIPTRNTIFFLSVIRCRVLRFSGCGFFFGYIKGRFTGSAPLRGAVQTLIIRTDAAAVAFFILKLIS